jgi:hypothetical protein
MPYGQSFGYIQETDESGVVSARPVPLERAGTPPAEYSLRDHFTLSGAFDPSNPRRIVANVPVDIEVGARFTKFSVQIRSADIAYIAVGRRADSGAGGYDDVHPGLGRLDERIEGATTISLLFPAVPPDPVEVIVYDGAAARPV